MILIKNVNVVLEDSIIYDGVILISEDRIISVGKQNELSIPEDAEIIDGKGNFAGPGFVDIHVHGGNGYLFNENPEKAAEHFINHGETTLLAAFYTNLSKEQYISSIGKVKDVMKNSEAGSAIAGFYMEGPYMNPSYGCDLGSNRWGCRIYKEDFKEVVKTAGKDAKVWVIAPEREGIKGFMEYCKEINPNIIFSVGHSEAQHSEIDRVKKYGIKILTHCMNATGVVSEYKGVLGAGPNEYCFLHDDMYAELISDSMGIHVLPQIQRMLIKIKGPHGVILISDSNVTEFDNQTHKAEDLCFDKDGNLAGSKLTLDKACKNIMAHTGCGMCDAFRMASLNGAKAIGLDGEIGSVTSGKKANLVICDDEFNIKTVILEGKIWRQK